MKEIKTGGIYKIRLLLNNEDDDVLNNNNCDGSGPHSINPEVRVLPTGGDSNAILCFTCFLRELQFRKQRNKELSKESQFKLPSWESLKKYAYL